LQKSLQQTKGWGLSAVGSFQINGS
jgi:hypothetical protein